MARLRSTHLDYFLITDPLPYFRKGMLRDAERQLKSSLMDQDMVVTYLELVKVPVNEQKNTRRLRSPQPPQLACAGHPPGVWRGVMAVRLRYRMPF